MEGIRAWPALLHVHLLHRSLEDGHESDQPGEEKDLQTKQIPVVGKVLPQAVDTRLRSVWCVEDS
jgi:hypothetical protein